MERDDLLLLLGYNRWANDRVLAACRGLTPEQLLAPAAVSFTNLLGTLAHVLGSEQAWRLRLQTGVSPERMLSARDFAGLDDLEALSQREAAALRAFVESLGPDDPQRWVEYTTTSGERQGSTLWRALAHLVNHGTQFRGEAGAALAVLGHSPGDLDFLLYQRETDQR